MKPVRGGRPPKESNTSGASAVRAGSLAQEEASALTLRDLVTLKVRNAEKVMVM